jgi:hypothetical protein
VAIEINKEWPPESQRDQWRKVNYLGALRDSDEKTFRNAAHYFQMGGDRRKPYLMSPLPRLIASVVADMLFGEEPRFMAVNENDTDALGRIIRENQLPAELHRAAVIGVSEGEVWGRVMVDRQIARTPIIDFHSRASVIPYFRGRFLVEAALITELPKLRNKHLYRIVEIHRAGEVETRLYKGSDTSLGDQVALEERPETAGAQTLVQTGIDRPLMVRIVNKVGRTYDLGQSDYEGIEQLFLALNEGLTISQQNMRLTGAKRLLVDRDYLDKKGRLQLADDVFTFSAGGMKKLGEGGGADPFTQLSYSFEAKELVAWIDWLLDHTLTAAGISPASVGRSEVTAGATLSGTALRLRMAHTLSEIAGKGRIWDAGVAELLRMAQILDAKPLAQGGFGTSWSDPETAPIMQRGDGLPEDPREDAQVIAQLAGAEALSTEEKVRRLNPGWTDQRVEEEIAKIEAGMPDPLADPFPDELAA